MTDRLAAVGYRLLAPRASLSGTGDSLNNIITSPLPDGAQCFVTANRTLYILDKTSTAAADGSTIIAPIGGAGRWVAQSGAAALAQPGADAFGTTSVPGTGVIGTLTLTTELFSDGVTVDLPGNRFVIGTAGRYWVGLSTDWASDPLAARIEVLCSVAGQLAVYQGAAGAGNSAPRVTTLEPAPLAAGEVITARARQGTGADPAINLTARLYVQRIG